MSDRASGWYPDPNDPDTLRYWDGILWTERTMPRVKPGLDQSHLNAPPPPQVDHHGGPGAPLPPASRRPVLTTPDGQVLSGWWRRVVALMIDNVLTFAVGVPMAWHWLAPWVNAYARWFSDAYKAASQGKGTPDVPDSVLQFPWQVGLVVVGVALVYEVVLTVWRGQTIGKMLLGIKVRRIDDERPPSLVPTFYRSVIKQLSSITGAVPVLGVVATVFQAVDYLRPLGDRYRQAFHDTWPRTYVVRTGKSAVPPVAPDHRPYQPY